MIIVVYMYIYLGIWLWFLYLFRNMPNFKILMLISWILCGFLNKQVVLLNTGSGSIPSSSGYWRDPQPMVLAKAKLNNTVHLVHIWPYILLSFSISHVVFVCLMLSLYVQCLKYESKMYIVLFQYNHKLYTAYFAFFFLFCFLMADSVSLRISSAWALSKSLMRSSSIPSVSPLSEANLLNRHLICNNVVNNNMLLMIWQPV